MKKGVFCLFLVVLTMPLLAQKNGDEPNPAQMPELMDQIFERQKQLLGTLSDSTRHQIPMNGLLKFYQNFDADSLDVASAMEEVQKMMTENLDALTLKKDLQSGDLQRFMRISPDSLLAPIKLFEELLGDEFQQVIPKELEQKDMNGKKKRKAYSL